jgi:hypothetical protein
MDAFQRVEAAIERIDVKVDEMGGKVDDVLKILLAQKIQGGASTVITDSEALDFWVGSFGNQCEQVPCVFVCLCVCVCAYVRAFLGRQETNAIMCVRAASFRMTCCRLLTALTTVRGKTSLLRFDSDPALPMILSVCVYGTCHQIPSPDSWQGLCL